MSNEQQRTEQVVHTFPKAPAEAFKYSDDPQAAADYANEVVLAAMKGAALAAKNLLAIGIPIESHEEVGDQVVRVSVSIISKEELEEQLEAMREEEREDEGAEADEEVAQR